MSVSSSLDRAYPTGRLLAALASASVLLASTVHAQEEGSRVVAARDALVVRTCPEASCPVLAELPRGQAVQVLKSEGGWHRVLVTLGGSTATTGWIDGATAVAAPRAAVTYAGPRTDGGSTLSAKGPAGAGPAEGAECLACLATRTATPDEWSEALALTSGMKATRAPLGPPAPAVPEGEAARPATRAESVRRDGRSTLERMRDEVNARFGDELGRLSRVAATIDPDLQSYIAVCYDRYLPVTVLPPGPGPAAPPPGRPRATVFDLWRGRPTYAWNETWSTQVLVSAESTAFCQGLWNDLSSRAAAVKSAVERVEAEARAADIYPGVVRDALEAYGLTERR